MQPIDPTDFNGFTEEERAWIEQVAQPLHEKIVKEKRPVLGREESEKRVHLLLKHRMAKQKLHPYD